MEKKREKATFAGGCFWCMVKPFDHYAGVENVIAGYTGGHLKHPTYEQVCQGETGHVEAVEITFDPERISYDDLLAIFWKHIDPTDGGGQFADRGASYRPVIFYHSESQRKAAEVSKAALAKRQKDASAIAVTIEPATTFYPAESYHQDFYKKQPDYYNRYYQGSGRSDFIKRHDEGQ